MTNNDKTKVFSEVSCVAAGLDELAKSNTVENFLKLLKKLTDCDFCALYYSDYTNEFSHIYSFQKVVSEQPISIYGPSPVNFDSESIVHFSKILPQSSQALIFNELASSPFCEEVDCRLLRNAIVLPFYEQNQIKFILWAFNKKTGFNDKDQAILSIISDQLWHFFCQKRLDQQKTCKYKKFLHIINNVGNNFVIFSLDGASGHIDFISETSLNVFGLENAELQGLSLIDGINWTTASRKDIQNILQKDINEVEQTEIKAKFYPLNNQTAKTIRIVFHRETNFPEAPAIIDGLIEDITEKEQMSVIEKRAANVFKSAYEAIVITDQNTKILDVNSAFCDITGYLADEVIGKPISILQSGKHDKSFYQQMWAEIKRNGHWSGEIWNKRKSGEIYPERLVISAVSKGKEKVSEYIGVFSDITETKKYLLQLEKDAYHDSLTGLPNRSYLFKALEYALKQLKTEQIDFAVAFLDLDGFKSINDDFGHDAGDALLKELSKNIQSSLRSEDVVARLAGDEFVILLQGVRREVDLKKIMNNLLSICTFPVAWNEQRLKVSASIGVCFSSQLKEPVVESLINSADKAMYAAKSRGKNQYVIFSGQITAIKGV